MAVGAGLPQRQTFTRCAVGIAMNWNRHVRGGKEVPPCNAVASERMMVYLGSDTGRSCLHFSVDAGGFSDGGGPVLNKHWHNLCGSGNHASFSRSNF